MCKHCVFVCLDVSALKSHWRVSGEEMRLGYIQTDAVNAGSSPSGSIKIFPLV